MSTDPHIEKPDDQARETSGNEQTDADQNQRGEEPSEQNTNPRFLELAEEAGRTFREALDRLA
jgi:hypothetical protein